MALTRFEKEMAAVAISVAAGCRPCTRHHVAEVRKEGASDEDIATAVAAAVCVRNSATEGMRRAGLGLASKGDGGCGDPTSRLGELMAMGASLAVHCEDNVARHRAAAMAVGADNEDIRSVAALVRFIHERAFEHAEARMAEPSPVLGKSRPVAGCCGA